MPSKRKPDTETSRDIKASSLSSSKDLSLEGLLRRVLEELCALLLRVRATELQAILPSSDHMIRERAKEEIESNLTKQLVRLVELRGPHVSHKSTSYAQVSAEVLRRVESALTGLSRQRTEQANLQDDLRRTDAATVATASLARELAMKDQMVATLVEDKTGLETHLHETRRENQSLREELELARRAEDHSGQRLVEIQLRGLDFKSEVERRSRRVEDSVRSRLGFVPSAIAKELAYLRLLKSPGSAEYDEYRVLSLLESQKEKRAEPRARDLRVLGNQWTWARVVQTGDRASSPAAGPTASSVTVDPPPVPPPPGVRSGSPSKLLHLLSRFDSRSARAPRARRESPDSDELELVDNIQI